MRKLIVQILKRRGSRPVPLALLLLGIFASVLVPLALLSQATSSLTAPAATFSPLLLLNLAGGLLLFLLVLANLLWLRRRLKRRAPGALLARKLIALFGGLALFPAAILFAFALQLLDRSIDSWFDLQIDRALKSALELTRRVAEVEARRLRREGEEVAPEVAARLSQPELLPLFLEELRQRLGLSEAAVLTTRGEIVALSGPKGLILPSLPPGELLLRAKREGGLTLLDPTPSPRFSEVGELAVRALLPLEGDRIIQLIRPLPTSLLSRAQAVERSYRDYRQMAYLRRALKLSFAATLSLILLVSLLAAFLAAFLSTRRLVRPIQLLLEGTRAVAEGNLERRLPVVSRDDMGQLIAAFNAMVSQLEAARNAQLRAHRQLEAQRAYLEAVLDNLTSGVLTLSLGEEGRPCVEIVNRAASEMLELPRLLARGEPLEQLARLRPELLPWVEEIAHHLRAGPEAFRFELQVAGRILLTRGGPIPGRQDRYVVVFDDITALVQAKKQAAWSEMARRLAHEIKNPLTPIQLAAERLNHKLKGELSEEGARLLERSTRTIIQQVEALRDLATAFSDFARPPRLKPEPVDLAAFFESFTTLYPPASGVAWRLAIPEALPEIEADPAALRQLFHNLTRNALEAKGGEVEIEIAVEPSREGVVIHFRDNGPGIPQEVGERIFEPYVTTKTKGSGLGLAIVRRIVEEHGGRITLEESKEGAAFRIELPRKIPRIE